MVMIILTEKYIINLLYLLFIIYCIYLFFLFIYRWLQLQKPIFTAPENDLVWTISIFGNILGESRLSQISHFQGVADLQIIYGHLTSSNYWNYVIVIWRLIWNKYPVLILGWGRNYCILVHIGIKLCLMGNENGYIIG